MRVAVFAKAPIPGAVKTRLAALLGADAAAGLHAGLVRHALATAVEARVGPVELWCAPDERHPFFERCATQFRVALRRQEGADLGERMQRAFASAFADGSPLVLIGADCPALDVAHVRAAADALASHDAVLGPAEDGGYVLVGLAAAAPAIFRSIDWGTSAVMAATRAQLRSGGMRWHELPVLWDIDRPEDYERLRREGRLGEVLS